MRVVPFLVSLAVTIGLIVVLNVPLTIGGSKTPRFGMFVSPLHGFWQNAEPDSLNLNLNLKFPQLKGKVEVYFDDRLVPHVYAEQESDLYFVQGYLHARFRLWQMEFETYAAAGRLSEIVGAKSGTTDFVAIDRFFRRLGMGYAAENGLKALEANPVTKMEADSYTAGVNAYISSLSPGQYPVEYKLLDYKPAPWSNLKTVLFLKYMAYDLAGSEWDFEMTNARNFFSAADFERLYPTVQDSLDPIIPKGTAFAKPGVNITKPAAADSVFSGGHDSLGVTLTRPDKDNGSNNWAVAGSKTKSGRPILCNDPHLTLYLPSIWYEMQLSTPTFNTYGVTFPGAPSMVIGFNDSCAWGFTNAMRDVRDYYEIRFKDTTMNEYWFNGGWKKTEFRKEVIKVKGGKDLVENIAMTVFGPVMYDHHYPNKSEDDKYYAVRWKAHDPSNELLTFNKLNRAKNYGDYLNAISTYQCPGQNMVFASKGGDIAIRQQGVFPAKWKRQGDFVMPGEDSTFAWQATIPVNENPMMLNPSRGFVSSANQLPADDTYPYYLGGSYPPYRGISINRQLSVMNDITPEDMELLQTDNYNVFAEMARPILLNNIDENHLSGEDLKYVDALRKWNLYGNNNEEGQTIFKVWWDSLEVAVWGDEFAQSKLVMNWPEKSTLVEALLKDSSYKFVDDVRTGHVETLKDAVEKSFLMAVKELKTAQQNHRLPWGKYKDTGIRHMLRIGAFSRLHLPVGGGEHMINATKENHGPSWRMVVQLTDPIEGYGVYPGGQSGNPGSYYYDNFVDSWVQGKYYRLLFVTREEATNTPKVKWKMTFSKG